MFAPAPTSSVDWQRLGISITDVSGHVESTYSVKTGAWSSPSFVQEPYLRVHGLAPGLNYGQQAYEGLKAHRAPDSEINIFRLPVHAARLSHSASYVSIPAIPDEHFNACVRMAVARNAEFVPPHESEALLYIRPIVFGSSGHISLTAPEQFTFAVFVSPGTAYHGVKPLDACVLEDFDRAAPRGTGSAKVGGNYAPVIRWTDKARSEGFAVTLHLDAETRTMIDEFSTSGFLGIKKGDDGSVTVVVPDSKNVIQSVTSDSCCQIASRMGWKVEKRPIPWTELATFSEVVAVGTAASLLPIKSITRHTTNEKIEYGAETGECTLVISTTLKNIMKGKAVDPFGWLNKIKESDLLIEEPPVSISVKTPAEVSKKSRGWNFSHLDSAFMAWRWWTTMVF